MPSRKENKGRFARLSLNIMLGASVAIAFPLWAADPQYDDLVRQARSGDTTPLLGYLREQEERQTLTASQVADWLQVANWAGRDAEVVAVWDRYHSRFALPARGAVAAARSQRNLKQWNASLALWELAASKEPDNPDITAGKIMTLADARRFTSAEAAARDWAQRAPSATSYETLAYVLKAQGKNWDALFAATVAEEANPQNAYSRQFLQGSLTDNRIAGPALAMATAQNTSAAQQRQLRSNAAAELVRTAFTPSRNEQERYLVADRALSEYDQMLRDWRNDPAAQADYQRARVDRLGALLARQNTAEVVRQYETLVAEGKPVPEYARRWVALAYLAQQQPSEANALMTSITPNASGVPGGDPLRLSVEDHQSLFYTRMESEDYAAAKQQADLIVARSPWMLRHYGSPTPEPNDYWQLGQLLQAQYRSMTNDLEQAEILSCRLARTAPGNQGLRILYASVLQARGLPRAAERELKLAELLEPTNLDLESQQASVAMDLQEWKQAWLLIDDAVARDPQDLRTRQLVRDREVFNKSELRISGHQGIDSNSPVSGQHDFSVNSALYGPPMGDNVRLFAGFNFATGEFEEGKGYDRDLLGGVEWRSRDYWAEAELSHRNYSVDSQIGARLSAWHDFSDNWRIGGSAERMAASTPLRALRNGVTANGGNAYLRWYQNERREYTVSIAPSWFSDGNNRMEYLISGKERLWTTPRFTLDFTPSISASSNSKSNVPYYNPKRDLSIVPALTADHQLWRAYDKSWSQQFYLAVGSYQQKHYGSGSITTVGYGQRLQLNNVVDTGFMLTWDKRPYDGVRERNIAVSFDLNVRF